MKAGPGKDIWLFGGGSLFRSLAEHGLVDTVEVGVVPILLGEGIPLLPSPAPRIKLSLSTHKVYKTGVVAWSTRLRRFCRHRSALKAKVFTRMLLSKSGAPFLDRAAAATGASYFGSELCVTRVAGKVLENLPAAP